MQERKEAKKGQEVKEKQELQKKQETREAKRASEGAKTAVSETWAEETIADLDEFIESQGIYIRQ